MKIWGSILVAGIFMGCINSTTHEQDEDTSTNTLRQSSLNWHKNGTSDDKTKRHHGGYHKDKGCRWNKKEPKPLRVVAGCWSVEQSNGHSGMLRLIQKDSVLTGQMDWYTFSDSPVEGKISGDSVSYALAYPDMVPLVGYYYATLDSSGTNLVGTAVSNNGHSATWSARKTNCPAVP
jgi:hypothetical protein